MRYFSIYIPAPSNAGRPTGERARAMDTFVAGAVERGELIMGGGFLSIRDHGVVMRRSNGVSTIIDGPYAESKELLGGFAMLEYASREAAIEGARKFLEVAGDGECVTYQIMTGPGEAECADPA
jgi:hypothetical protein